MASTLGFRQTRVFENVPANTEVIVDEYRGAFLYSEVTNETASKIYLIVNDNQQGGHAGARVPIAPNATRAIPASLYTFKATGIVTVVAYGM